MANIFTTTLVYPKDIATRKTFYQAKSDTVSGRIQVRSLGVARREFTIAWPPMLRSEFKAVWSFLDALQLAAGTFEIYLPDVYAATPDGSLDWVGGVGMESVTVRLTTGVQEFAIGVNGLYAFEIDCVEVLS